MISELVAYRGGGGGIRGCESPIPRLGWMENSEILPGYNLGKKLLIKPFEHGLRDIFGK
jgi:hypothetical protein